MAKELEAIRGTNYKVTVERDTNDYVVSLYRPANNQEPYIELELVGMRVLRGGADVDELNILVREMIRLDVPSLEGVYEDNGVAVYEY